MSPFHLLAAVTLSGFVLDAGTGDPVSEAIVALPFLTEEVRVTEGGAFSFDVDPGAYDVYASAPGYEELRALEVDVPRSGRAGLVLELRRLSDHVRFPAVYRLGDVNVTASRHRGTVLETPREVFTVSEPQLRERLTSGTPEALDEIPQVLVQKTSLGGGAPIVRGLSGNRILLLVDGVRLNNSTYRIGLNQYLNTVDPGIVERVEVVPGAGSVLYGSDALGGVIQVMTVAPGPDRPRLSYTGQVTTSEGSQTHGLRVGRWWGSGGAVVSLGLRELEHLEGGGDIGVQRPTGYSEWSGAARVLLKPGPRDGLTLAYQISRQDDVPRIDRVAAGKDSLWLYDPQHRELFFARYETERLAEWIESASLSLSWNHQREGREIISNDNVDTLQSFTDDVRTFGLTADAQTLVAGPTLLTYGAEIYYDAVDSQGKETNLETKLAGDIPGKFPDDGEHFSLGAYLQVDRSLGGRLKVIGALRYSAFRLEGTPLGPFGKVRLDNSVVTAAAQTRLRLGAETFAFAGVSQSFRAPNMEDALSAGLSNKGYDVPNPDLEPERGVNLEAGFKSSGIWMRTVEFLVQGTGFLTLVDDFIERTPATFLGSDSLAGQPVFRNENQGNARIVGLSGAVDARVGGAWALRSAVSWTRGQNTDLRVPLTRIPPLRGTLSARRDVKSAWIETVFQWALKQDRLSPDDLRDSRIPEGGTPGYFVIHLRAGYRVLDGLALRAKLENLSDEAYQVHGSGIYQSGRNVTAGVEWTLP